MGKSTFSKFFMISTYFRQYVSSVSDFDDILLSSPDKFVVLRHDVEFSVLRALEIAQIEKEYEVCSFNFQVVAHTYNIFSNINVERIKSIEALGHKIGLHFYHSHIRDHDWSMLENEFKRQMNMLLLGTGCNCNRFSFHRPKAWMLEPREDYMFESINQYGPSFFEYSPKPKIFNI